MYGLWSLPPLFSTPFCSFARSHALLPVGSVQHPACLAGCGPLLWVCRLVRARSFALVLPWTVRAWAILTLSHQQQKQNTLEGFVSDGGKPQIPGNS